MAAAPPVRMLRIVQGSAVRAELRGSSGKDRRKLGGQERCRDRRALGGLEHTRLALSIRDDVGLRASSLPPLPISFLVAAREVAPCPLRCSARRVNVSCRLASSSKCQLL
jgi:hypothetical protein